MDIGAQGFRGGGLQRLDAELPSERQQSRDLPGRLLRMIGAKEDFVRQRRDGAADSGGLFPHGVGRHSRRRPMLRRPMFVEGDGRAQNPRLQPEPGVGGDPFALVEDTDQAGRAICVDPLADQPERNGVGDAVNGDVIVRPELEAFPAPKDKGFGRKLFQPRLLIGLEQAQTRLRRVGAEGAAVELGEFFRHGGVQFVQAEERPVPQRRQNPALDLLHAILRGGLVAGLFHPRRDHADPIVLRQRQIGVVQLGIVIACVGHPCFEIVRDKLRGAAAPGGEHPHMTAKPVLAGLRPRRLGIDQARERRDADKDARLDLAVRPDHRHGHAGVVHLAYFAGRQRSPHPRFGRQLQMLPVMSAELTVAVAVWMNFEILPPNQQQGHRGFEQLLRHLRPVRQRARLSPFALTEQQRFDFCFAFLGDVLIA
jgi:hypothetical protein